MTDKINMAEVNLREDYAIVIIWDDVGKRFFLQQKDGTHAVPLFQHQFTPYGSGLKPELHETKEMAIKRRFSKELPGIRKEVCEQMVYWKPFCLRWEPPLDEQKKDYTCHVYVMILTRKYHLEDLKNRAYTVDKESDIAPVIQGTLSIIDRGRVEEMIKGKAYGKNYFMASRNKVIREFLETLDEMGAEGFIEDLKQRNAS